MDYYTWASQLYEKNIVTILIYRQGIQANENNKHLQSIGKWELMQELVRNATKAACLSTLNSYVAAETMNCSGYFQSPDRSHKQIETEGHKAI